MKKRVLSSFLAITLLMTSVSPVSAEAAEKMSIAVMDFEDIVEEDNRNGIDLHEADSQGASLEESTEAESEKEGSVSGTCGVNLTWTLDESTGVLVISGTGAMTNYVTISQSPFYNYRENIQAVILEDGVTTIGWHAFYGCTNLKTVSISESSALETIGKWAFYSCYGLEEIILPDTLTEIGGSAFYYCESLASINIPCSVESIGAAAFGGCSALDSVYITDIGAWCGITFSYANSQGGANPLSNGAKLYLNGEEATDIVIPDGVAEINDYAFYQCPDIETVKIPDTVTGIGNRAFQNCTALRSVTTGNSVADIGEYAFSGCTSLGQIEIPDSVTSIGAHAFRNCTSLTEVNIPDSMSRIESYAFYGCTSLDAVEIPDGILSIGESAFNGCEGMRAVSVSGSSRLETIEQNAFYCCYSLEEMTLPDTLTTIGRNAFYNCKKLQSINVPGSVVNIGTSAFSGCSALGSVYITDLEAWCGIAFSQTGANPLSNGAKLYLNGEEAADIVIPDSVTEINNFAFYQCTNIENVKIPDTISRVGVRAFQNCVALRSVTIGNSVTEIGEYAFAGCASIGQIEIPDRVTSVGIHAFRDCTELKSVIIGSGMTSIEDYTFYSCTGITDIEIGSNVTHIGEYAFAGCASIGQIEIPDRVTSVGAHAFQNCTSLKSVSMGSGMTSIENYTFYSCTGITDIEIGSNVTHIGEYAFAGCASIGQIEISDRVTSVGARAFQNCTSLKSVSMGSGMTSIEDYTFYSCIGITDIEIGNNVTRIGDYAFSGCKGLTELVIPDHVVETGECVFSECTGLERAVTGDGMARINRRMFSGCTNLETVVLSEKVTSLENGSFYNCKNLKSISLPSSLEVIASTVFYGCSSMTELVIPDSVTSIGTNFPSNVTVYVYAGSYAETYAINNKLNYEYISGNKTYVQLLTPSGNKIQEGYTVKWYSEETNELVSSSKELYVEGANGYRCKIILGEELASKYQSPEMILVNGGTMAEITLEELKTVTISGSVLDETGKVPNNLKVTIRQMANEYSSVQEVTVGNDGSFIGAVKNMTTSITFCADGYYSATRTLIASAFDGEAMDIGEIVLRPLSSSKITVNLSQMSVFGEETGKENAIASFDDVEFTLYNKTKNTEITDFVAQYPYIVIGEESAEESGDQITITASSPGTGEGMAEAVLDEDKSAYVKISLPENGTFYIKDISAERTVYLWVFDENGNYVQRYVADGSSLYGDSMPDGAYTLIFLEKNMVLRSCSSLDKLAAFGLEEGVDYVKESVNIEAGSISIVDTVEVPALDMKRLSYTVDSNTSVTVNRTEVVVGNYATVRISYEIEDTYRADSEKVTIEIPEHLTIAPGSVTLNGKSTPYVSDDDGNMVISASEPSGVIRFYVSASEIGAYEIHAALSFSDSQGKEYVQSIGTGKFSAENMFLTIAEQTASKEIHVSGSTRAKTKVTLYDGTTVIGTTTSSSDGNWLISAELSECYKYSTHTVYAEAELSDEEPVKSKIYQVFYDPECPQVSKVTMYSKGGKIVYDFMNPTLAKKHCSYWYEYPNFTFRVEFVDEIPESSEVTLYVHSEMETIMLKAGYDASTKSWMAYGEFDSGFLPVGVAVNIDNYNTAYDEDNNLSTAPYTWSVDDVNEYMETLLSKDESGRLNEEVEVLDGELGIYQYEDSIFLYESGYVYYGSDAFPVKDLGLEKENFKEVPLEDGTSLYCYCGMLSDYLYVTQMITDVETAGKLTKVFNQSVVNSLDSDEYIGVCTVFMDGIPVNMVDDVKKNFGTLAEAGEKETVSRNSKAAARDFSEAMSNAWNAVTDKAIDLSYQFYDFSTNAVDFMKFVNTVANLADYDDVLEGAEKLYEHGINIGTDMHMDDVEKEIYKMMQEIDYSSEYFPEAMELLNDYEKEMTNHRNGDTIMTGIEFAGNILGLSKGMETAVSVADKTRNLSEKSQTAAYYNRAKALYDKYMESKDQDDGENDNKGDGSEGNKNSSWSTVSGSSGSGAAGTNMQPSVGGKTEWCIDPSGYVYEAVPSNRVEGVSATAWYLKDILDNYGQETGKQEEVLWDAENYGQGNPLVTDADGWYSWDVPSGRWIVTYEKDGYYPTNSSNSENADGDGYLPVPPPQFDINVGLVSKAAPEVENVTAYKYKIYITFSQYMEMDSINTENVTVELDGAEISGTIVPCNAESNYEGTDCYADEYIFTPSEELSGSVVVSVGNAINYAGTKMENSFSVKADVEIEPEGIYAIEKTRVELHSEKELCVQVLPKEAGAGMKIKASSELPDIVSVSNEEIILDENGVGYFTVEGHLPGKVMVHFTLEGTNQAVSTEVSVVNHVSGEAAKCGIVQSNIPSGTSVDRGTELILSTSTENAVIYYTTDGSDPRIAGTNSVMKYEGAISLSENMAIIAYAAADGYENSDLSLFTFTIHVPPAEPPVTDETEMPPITDETEKPPAADETEAPLINKTETSVPETQLRQKVGEVFTGSDGVLRYEVIKMSSASSVGQVAVAGILKNKAKIIIPAETVSSSTGEKFKVTAIGKSAFKGNRKLVSVTIGKNITSIKDKAFFKCKKLKRIVIKTTKLGKIGKKALTGISKKATIKVPAKKWKLYKKKFNKKTGLTRSMKVIK